MFSFRTTRVNAMAIVIAAELVQSVNAATPTELSDADRQAIERFVDDHASPGKVLGAVGQLLLVGVPGDARNIRDTPTRDLVVKHGIGSIFLNPYYYRGSAPNLDEVTRAAVDFHNELQSRALASHLGLPVILATDAEHSKDGVWPAMYLPPIEALTLASTTNGDLIRENAIVTGHQLRAIGVNMVMGPVLDVSRRGEGIKFGYPLGTRTFGASTNWVASAASHYSAGLKDNRLLVIGKHFPGLGSLDSRTNLHAKMDYPELIATAELLSQDLHLYEAFKDKLDGLMTAHVRVPAFASQGSQRVVTKSRLLVDGLVRGSQPIRLSDNAQLPTLNAPDLLVVSDDLTDMGPTVWERTNGATLEDQAWDAFLAGHDLLLIAHVEASNGTQARGKIGRVTSREVVQVLGILAQRIESSPANLQRFKASLRRIVTAKAKLVLAQRRSVEELLAGKAV